MQAADHGKRQRPVSAQHLIDAGTISDDSDQCRLILTLLFKAKLDCFNGVGHIDWEMNLFVRIHECEENIKAVSLGSSIFGAPKALDLSECGLVIL